MLNIQNPARSAFNIYNECVELDFEDRLSKIAIETQMTDEFLMMTDRFSMAHSIEARTPYLDHEFVDLSNNLPVNLKYNMFKIIRKITLHKYFFSRTKRVFFWTRTVFWSHFL